MGASAYCFLCCLTDAVFEALGSLDAFRLLLTLSLISNSSVTQSPNLVAKVAEVACLGRIILNRWSDWLAKQRNEVRKRIANRSKELKKLVGIVVIVFGVSMLLIERSIAEQCLGLNSKFKDGNREQKIQAILDYGNCVKKENKARVGKWFCYVKNMVGIQVDDDNKIISSGNVKPNDEKFFVAIEEISDDQKRLQCDQNEFGIDPGIMGFYLSGLNTNPCLANYKIRFPENTNPNIIDPLSTDGIHFYRAPFSFALYETNDFVLFRTFKSSYVSHGKCEKIN